MSKEIEVSAAVGEISGRKSIRSAIYEEVVEPSSSDLAAINNGV